MKKTVTINKYFVEQFKTRSEVSKANMNNRINTYEDEDSLTLRFTIEDFDTVEKIVNLCENETVEVDAVFEKKISNKGIYFTLHLTIHQTEENEPEFELINSFINEITEVIRQESRVTKELAKEKAGQRIQNEIRFASFANSDLFTLIKNNFELKPNSSDTAMFGVYKHNRNVKCVFINYQNVIDSYDTFDVSITYTKHPTPESKIEHRFKVVFRPEPKFVDEDDFNFVIPTFFKHLVENSVITVKAADKLHDCFF